MSVEPVRHQFSVEDYYGMDAAGLFEPGARLELIEGEVIEMSPIGHRHAGCVNRLNRLLTVALGERAVVTVQNPIRLSDISELQPDVAVLKPRPDQYAASHPHPEDALLVIEVADTTLRFDRTVKRRAYAAAEILELWIVDVDVGGGAVEVATIPGPTGYASIRRLGPADTIAPIALPDLTFELAAILG